MTTRTLPRLPIHPALVSDAEQRARNVQNRIADRITLFAGSMTFVYVHLVWFSVWIAGGVEDYPYGLLTMLVSLEAIFLSTFVMISQNRADEKRQVLANHQWELIQLEQNENEDLLALVQTEKQQNDDLLGLSRRILDLTTEVHDLTAKVHGLVQRGTP